MLFRSYNTNDKEFIASSLAPAENLDIDLNDKKKTAVVVVPDDQLSLAIGRGGQNVRLAAKLTGYKIDIKGQSGKTSLTVTGEEEFEIDQLGLSKRVRKLLVEQNIITIHILRARLESKDKIPGLGPKALKEINTALEAIPEPSSPAAPTT